MKKLIQFGAGNIGRSFIGQLFSEAGYEVVFVDVNQSLIDELNKKGTYKVCIKEDSGSQILAVNRIRAVNINDRDAVADEIAEASCIATSVGKNILPRILPVVAEGLLKRSRPIDIILAENIHNGAYFAEQHLKESLPSDYPLKEMAGLVETSIGKMVPLVSGEDLKKDPLMVYAEAYNTLIVDGQAFLTEQPDIKTLKAVSDIRAYVDRKLFIHNMGHAAAAYLGYAYNSEWNYIWEALSNQQVYAYVKEAMKESGYAVADQYPHVFTRDDIDDHIKDLLYRFSNKALGDTIYRVGRDLPRKLGREDRVIGALRLASSRQMPNQSISRIYHSAIRFRKKDLDGKLFPADEEFHNLLEREGEEAVLEKICGLSPLTDSQLIRNLMN
ncbi:MAG: mannitol-1-phosphate 5-dehydrogenase [Spirochaetales bacterium]|nr:mannitol-1-phosphate 5-dehydrogenase [Spirochaetales bacterium]